MKIEQLLESEKEQLLYYLFGYCDNPTALFNDYLIGLFNKYKVEDESDIREILEQSFKCAYFNSSPPDDIDASIWLNISEIEVSAEEVEEEERDEFTFTNGGFAYYYIGYGLTVELNELKLIQLISEKSYERALERSLYTCIHYFDVWLTAEGYKVNNVAVLERDIHLDIENLTDR